MLKAYLIPSRRSPIMAFFGAMALCLICSGAVQGQSGALDQEIPSSIELWRRYIENNGGQINIQALTSLIIDGEIVSSAGVVLEFKLVRKRPNLSRMKTEFEETVFNGQKGKSTVFDRSGKRTVNVLEGAALAALERNSGVDGPFFQLAGHYDAMHPVAIENVLGEPAVRVELDSSIGSLYHTIWLSMEHFQEVKMARNITPDGAAPYEEEVYFSNFEKIDGIQYGKKIDYYKDGVHRETIRVLRIRTNVGIFNSYFEVN